MKDIKALWDETQNLNENSMKTCMILYDNANRNSELYFVIHSYLHAPNCANVNGGGSSTRGST